MENIKAILQQASEDYYNGKPSMSDEQFDKLAEYAKYDEVGFSSRDNRIPHAFQMYSLQKIFCCIVTQQEHCIISLQKHNLYLITTVICLQKTLPKIDSLRI